MKKIDIANWKRIKHYNFYKDFDFPLFSITVNLDITDFVKHVKANDIRFFPTFLYLMMKSMNNIDEFKYRIRGSEVVLHDTVTPSYTVLNNDDLYVFCTTDYDPDYLTFTNKVEADIEESKTSDRLEDIPGRDDLVFVSSLPWTTFTQMTHPIDTSHPDSFPRVTIGRYFEESHSIKIPICVFVHHGLCDGLHVSRFLEGIKKEIGEFIKQ
ncbi:MAG TPA: chloramphenicol acetyltransferase [Bacillota bacterium]|nr:chloramphenicol acetyltransferase [Bacillota bacterium]